MPHPPPPFFKRGPAPLVRLFFFASLSLALLVIDARCRYVDGLRSWLALAAYPLQRAATWPIDIALSVGGYFSTQANLIEENERLRAQVLANVQDAQAYHALQAEATELRRTIGAAEKLPVQAMPAEVLYLGRDPYSHKLFIDRGSVQGVRPGSPVADDTGVVGQVTRVHPLLSEVTLLTNPDQAIPVQVVRNGLRAVAFGGAARRRARRGPKKRQRMIPSSSQILMPVRMSTIIGSFALALFLNFLPWRDLRLVPDFVALVLCFWCVRQPRLVGLGVGWTLGLLTDAGNGVLLGQHALAYSLLAFLSVWMSRRILWFGPLLQSLHIALILLVTQAAVLLVRLAAGDQFPGWPIVVGPLGGAVLWPLVTWLLLLPQRRPEREQAI